MNDVLMVIKTSGLEYDDRLRKECISLIGRECKPKILVLTDSNKPAKGLTEYNVPFQTISLIMRKFLSHKKGLHLKIFEMYLRFIYLILLKRPQILWLHNIEMVGLVPFGRILKKLGVIDKLVWDQHELPPESVLQNLLQGCLFSHVLNMCDAIIVANKERRDFLLSHFGGKTEKRFHVLENFVDNKFASLPKGALPYSLVKWRKGAPYIIALGGANPGRYIDELVEAIEHFDNMKLVIVGPYESDVMDNLKKRWGNKLDELCYFTGSIPQSSMVNYIDDAMASIVLYNYDKDNNRLCAPNRLYQSIARSIPVIVGANPTMANLINHYGCGVILSDDGRDVNSIRSGVRMMIDNLNIYKEQTVNNSDMVTWEGQLNNIQSIIEL